ncbi:MAG: discoidin domain-containing protein [Candidatus Heimdallarchaeota archaeon]|nr:discoidin domain-containing protein [Candidatus Heimdallarchaeota archaeon]
MNQMGISKRIQKYYVIIALSLLLCSLISSIAISGQYGNIAGDSETLGNTSSIINPDVISVVIDDFNDPVTGYDSSIWNTADYGTADKDISSGETVVFSSGGHSFSGIITKPEYSNMKTVSVIAKYNSNPAPCKGNAFGFTDMEPLTDNWGYYYWNSWYNYSTTYGAANTISCFQGDTNTLGFQYIKDGYSDYTNPYTTDADFHNYTIVRGENVIHRFVDGILVDSYTNLNRIPTIDLPFVISTHEWCGGAGTWIEIDKVVMSTTSIISVPETAGDNGESTFYYAPYDIGAQIEALTLDNPLWISSHNHPNSYVSQILPRDITGDGIDEVIVALNTYGVIILDSTDGSVLVDYFISDSIGFYIDKIVAKDLNQDGVLEIIFSVRTSASATIGGMYILDNAGNLLSFYNAVPTEASSYSGPWNFDVQDVNSDDKNELIIMYGNMHFDNYGNQPATYIVDMANFASPSILSSWRHTQSGITYMELVQESNGDWFVTYGGWGPSNGYKVDLFTGTEIWNTPISSGADRRLIHVGTIEGWVGDYYLSSGAAYGDTSIYFSIVDGSNGSIIWTNSVSSKRGIIPLGTGDFNHDGNKDIYFRAFANTVQGAFVADLKTGNIIFDMDGLNGPSSVNYLERSNFYAESNTMDINGDGENEVLVNYNNTHLATRDETGFTHFIKITNEPLNTAGFFIFSVSTKISIQPNEYSHYEDFSTDVIASGEWVADVSSITVDTTNGYLDIGNGDGYSEGANYYFTEEMNLPLSIEYRQNLVSGGANYKTPYMALKYNNGTIISTVFLYDSGATGWLFINGWTDIDNGPLSENLWWDTKIIFEETQASLWAKPSSSDVYEHIITESFNGDLDFDYLRFSQPWDAHCLVDWISINGATGETPSNTVPDAPSNLNAADIGHAIELTWQIPYDGGSEITQYNVYRYIRTGGPYTKINTTQNTYFTDYSVLPGPHYFYVVSAENSQGESELSNEVEEFITQMKPYTRNVALTENGGYATSHDYGSYGGYTASPDKINDGDNSTFWAGTTAPNWAMVQFNSTYNLTQIGIFTYYHSINFRVEISEDGSSWNDILGLIITPNEIDGVDGGESYYYMFNVDGMIAQYLRVYIETTDAPSSHIFQVGIYEIEAFANIYDTPPEISSSPINVKVDNRIDGIKLSWDQPLDDGGDLISHYNIYRAVRSGGPYSLIASTTTVLYLDEETLPGPHYFYFITAYNIAGESDGTMEVEGYRIASKPSGTNVAAVYNGATAYASDFGSYGGYTASPNMVNDGDNSTFWAGTNPIGWIMVEFDQAYLVHTIGIFTFFHSQTFMVEGLSESNTWFNLTNEISTPDEIDGVVGGESYYYLIEIAEQSLLSIRVSIYNSDAPAGHIYKNGILELEAFAELSTNEYHAPDPINDLTYSISYNTLDLMWTYPNDGGAPITSFNIYRKTSSSGSYYKVATVTDNAFSDELSFDTWYYYVVTADNGKESEYSNEVSIYLESPTTTTTTPRDTTSETTTTTKTSTTKTEESDQTISDSDQPTGPPPLFVPGFTSVMLLLSLFSLSFIIREKINKNY